MTTVWINTGAEWAGREHDPDAIDIEISDLEGWVTGLHQAKEQRTAMTAQLQSAIDAAWDKRDSLSITSQGSRTRCRQRCAGNARQRNSARVAEKKDGQWVVNQWLKKAVLLSFRLNDNEVMEGVAGGNHWDKVPSKFAGWGENRFREAGFRSVPGSIVPARFVHRQRRVVLMPSFVNIGAYVDEGFNG